MKVLIIGPSGAGKSYVATAWKRLNIPAFDAAELAGLSDWYNLKGEKVTEPASLEEAAKGGYAYLWSRRFLEDFLSQPQDVFLFGGSGNIFSLLHLFDRVFYLQIDPETQKQRLQSTERPAPHLDHDKDGNLVIWGDWFEAEAKKHGLVCINADQTPDQIYAHVKNHL